jgi:hypothetical protein
VKYSLATPSLSRVFDSASDARLKRRKFAKSPGFLSSEALRDIRFAIRERIP